MGLAERVIDIKNDILNKKEKEKYCEGTVIPLIMLKEAIVNTGIVDHVDEISTWDLVMNNSKTIQKELKKICTKNIDTLTKEHHLYIDIGEYNILEKYFNIDVAAFEEIVFTFAEKLLMDVEFRVSFKKENGESSRFILFIDKPM